MTPLCGSKAQPWRNGGGVTANWPASPLLFPRAGQPRGRRLGLAGEHRRNLQGRRLFGLPGMDRVLTVVEGELLLLSVDGAEHPLEKYRPFRFSGDAAAAGALPTGDIRDLNVITRSSAFEGYASIIELCKKRAHPVFGGQLGILLQGQATAAPGTAAGTSETAAAAPTTLGRYDAVVGSDADTPEILGRERRGRLDRPRRGLALGRLHAGGADAHRILREPLREPDRHDRDDNQDDGHDVDHRRWFGRKRFCRIQIGRVVSPAPMVNVVTMISSKLSAKASSPPASRAERSCGNVTSRNVEHTGAQICGRLLQSAAHPAQPCNHVVEHGHHTERGVRDHDGPQAQRHTKDRGEHVVQGDAGDDSGQRDRQDHEQADDVPAEEFVAQQGQRQERLPSTSEMTVEAAATQSEETKASRTPAESRARPHHPGSVPAAASQRSGQR